MEILTSLDFDVIFELNIQNLLISGQKYDIHGTSGHIYNIISTPSFQMNSQFLNYALVKASDATWFSIVGIKVKISKINYLYFLHSILVWK